MDKIEYINFSINAGFYHPDSYSDNRKSQCLNSSIFLPNILDNRRKTI